MDDDRASLWFASAIAWIEGNIVAGDPAEGLHDLRHAFAVHRVIAWYREGADVQACLPLLATYLGHSTLAGTQTYLTMTAELLGEASLRFERYAALGPENAHA